MRAGMEFNLFRRLPRVFLRTAEAPVENSSQTWAFGCCNNDLVRGEMAAFSGMKNFDMSKQAM